MARGTRKFSAGQELARRNVLAKMAAMPSPMNPADLARAAEINESTVYAFVNGNRWPQAGNRGRMERKLELPPGTIQAWAERDERFFAEPKRPASPTLDEATEVELAQALLDRIERRGTSAHPGHDV